MRKISKKTWPEYFAKILDGSKTYELRLNDFEASPGDVLVLQEFDPKTNSYTGRKIEKTITHVLKFHPDRLFWSKEDIAKHGLQILSLK